MFSYLSDLQFLNIDHLHSYCYLASADRTRCGNRTYAQAARFRERGFNNDAGYRITDLAPKYVSNLYLLVHYHHFHFFSLLQCFQGFSALRKRVNTGNHLLNINVATG